MHRRNRISGMSSERFGSPAVIFATFMGIIAINLIFVAIFVQINQRLDGIPRQRAQRGV